VWKTAENLDSRIVSRGLDPAIHVFLDEPRDRDVDARIKSGHASAEGDPSQLQIG
jgi:hypothetical protein